MLRRGGGKNAQMFPSTQRASLAPEDGIHLPQHHVLPTLSFSTGTTILKSSQPLKQAWRVQHILLTTGRGTLRGQEWSQLVKASDPHKSMICRYFQSTTHIQWVIQVLSCIFHGHMEQEVQASSTAANYYTPSGYMLTLRTIMPRCKRKATSPWQIGKTIRCLILNNLNPGDIKLTKISVNIQ